MAKTELPWDVEITLEQVGLLETYRRWGPEEQQRFIRWIDDAGTENRREGRVQLLIQNLSALRARLAAADSLHVELAVTGGEIRLDPDIAAAELADLAKEEADAGSSPRDGDRT